jgi:hypothetical protein
VTIYTGGREKTMPILNWLGKDKVVNHHRQVPYRTGSAKIK